MGLIYGNKFIVESKIESHDTEQVIKQLNEKYINDLNKIYKEIVSKCKRLRKYSNNRSEIRFRYNKRSESFVCYLDGFTNYAYEEDKKGKEGIKLLDNMKSDLEEMDKLLKEKLKPLKLKHKFINSENDGYVSISEYIESEKEYINKYNYLQDSAICLYITIDTNNIKSLKVSSSIKNKETYVKLYNEFAKFINRPYKLSGSGFNSTHISDICKIIGMSSERFNEYVSDNINTVGTKESFDPNNGDFDTYLSKRIGDHYILELTDKSSGSKLVYSIDKKRVYYLNYEHKNCEIFYNDYPYSSKELEDFLLSEDSKKSEMKELFRQVDVEKKYNLIK